MGGLPARGEGRDHRRLVVIGTWLGIVVIVTVGSVLAVLAAKRAAHNLEVEQAMRQRRPPLYDQDATE